MSVACIACTAALPLRVLPHQKRWDMPGSRTQFCLRLHTDFLVDADIHSIHEIRSAIRTLREEGEVVKTKLFAAPGRAENSRWREFFEEPGISFQPVPRGAGARGEANDDEIVREISKVSSSQPRRRIALMTQDTDFCDIVQGWRPVHSPQFGQARRKSTDTLRLPGLEVEYGSCRSCSGIPQRF